MNPIFIHLSGSLFLKNFKNRGHGMLFFLAETNLQQFVSNKQILFKQFVVNLFQNTFPLFNQLIIKHLSFFIFQEKFKTGIINLMMFKTIDLYFFGNTLYVKAEMSIYFKKILYNIKNALTVFSFKSLQYCFIQRALNLLPHIFELKTTY